MFQISINQLADFSRGTESKRRTIVAQQIVPSPVKTQHYQLAKARMKQFFKSKLDITPIKTGIAELRTRKPDKASKIADRDTSIEALQRFVKLKLPNAFKEIDLEVLTVSKGSYEVNGVEIIVAPDIIFKGQLNGKQVIGGLKIHISKNNPFGLEELRKSPSLFIDF